MPKKFKTPGKPKPKPLYKAKPPRPKHRAGSPPPVAEKELETGAHGVMRPTSGEFHHPRLLAPAHFELREDGSIKTTTPHAEPLLPGERTATAPSPKHRQPAIRPPSGDESPSPGGEIPSPAGARPSPVGTGEGGCKPGEGELSVPTLIFRSDAPFLRLYHGNSLALLDAIAAKYPEGRFDCIFADPPYFLSNGGITCHAGRMVRVDKGDWDKSRGPELNHEFNLEWLRRCQRVLKPHGTLWVSGTHHVIFSIGYALQQLGFKILNDIAWEKPNPPPNLSCRYFTHSTETLLWAAKNEKSKHVFNYQAMRKVTGKQMKTVWRRQEFSLSPRDEAGRETERGELNCATSPQPSPPSVTAERESNPIWTLAAPGSDEKVFGKHPTQKPVALVERCLLAATHEGDLVLDPFLGNGTTAVACVRLKRGCVGIELDLKNVEMAEKRVQAEITQKEGELFK